jgi:hypothetical protein
MNVFLDIDDVIFDWHKCYAKRFECKCPTKWDKSKKMQDRLQTLSTEKEFWMNLTVKNRPNFIPAGFVSARSIAKSWTVASLVKHKIPGRSNVHQVPWGKSKVTLLKELNCHIFVDDKYETFKECNKNGIFCLLMDAPHNQHIKTPYRIYTLDIENILYLWRKLR